MTEAGKEWVDNQHIEACRPVPDRVVAEAEFWLVRFVALVNERRHPDSEGDDPEYRYYLTGKAFTEAIKELLK